MKKLLNLAITSILFVPATFVVQSQARAHECQINSNHVTSVLENETLAIVCHEVISRQLSSGHKLIAIPTNGNDATYVDATLNTDGTITVGWTDSYNCSGGNCEPKGGAYYKNHNNYHH